MKAPKNNIGICGLIKRPELEFIDIGYAFLPEFWFKGFAKEAMTAVLNHTREELHQKNCKAIVNPDNIASIKLLEKLNFQFEKNMEFGPEKTRVKLYNIDLSQRGSVDN